MSTGMSTGTGLAVGIDQDAVWNGQVGAHWAAHVDRYDAMLADLNDALFFAASIDARDRVLDVGCGAGATTRIAASLAPYGHAVGVDISGPLLAQARARAAAERVGNTSYERGDAQVHPFPPGAYDVVISRGGVMFFRDHRAAFDQLARALRPGGRLAFVCPRPLGSASEEARALGLLARLLGEGGRAEPPSAETVAAERAMASLGDPDRIRAALGGYQDVSLTPMAVRGRWGQDPADAVSFVLSRTPDRTVSDATRAAMAEALAPYATERGVRLRSTVWLVTASRPH
ncbi:class I SAM-dependent methyltransferase [Streptomyces apocyni]|uniref:class I SAM-dependent methyltransferase n=1 Tax=Streptomyces apocyni TaxID=2654677 RepID=UPI001E2BD500|nr:class I SAM-dependent methyltransferase [Streptomyces apocyni]